MDPVSIRDDSVATPLKRFVVRQYGRESRRNRDDTVAAPLKLVTRTLRQHRKNGIRDDNVAAR